MRNVGATRPGTGGPVSGLALGGSHAPGPCPATEPGCRGGPEANGWPGSWRRAGVHRTVLGMPTPVIVFREFVVELRAGGPHRLALVLGSPGSLVLPLAVVAGPAVTSENFDAKPEGVSPSPGAPSRSQD